VSAPYGVQCRLCGCVPAADVSFHGHRGLVIMAVFRRLPGPFCQECGLAAFREMTAKTLIEGWWGIASFPIAPFIVLLNAVRRGRVANLPPPRPPARGPYRLPSDPGPPLLARPTALIGLAIPLAALILLCGVHAASS